MRRIGGSVHWAEGKARARQFLFRRRGDRREQTDGEIATRTIELLEKTRVNRSSSAAGSSARTSPCVAPKAYFAMHPQPTRICRPSRIT